MLDLDTRTAVLRLHQEGLGSRAIAHALGVSRNAVRRVVRLGQAEVPALERDERLAEHLDRIRELHRACQGNRVRVVEELTRGGIEVGYSTLTAFCRRHGIGVKIKKRAGQYVFEPGVEMQHDTSPHTVPIGGVKRPVQCASLVLGYSRMLYAQVYARWSRFEARLFLTEAIGALEGACERCLIDNSSVIVAHGTGPDAVMAPEMAAFAERFRFDFEAHGVGDANRSGKVERPFHYIENNFYAGRTFASIEDLNAQLRAWCDRGNRKTKRHLGAAPIERYGAERPRLRPLPVFIPEVYALHTRRVDVEGYVSVHTNRYSVPEPLIGRQVTVRESGTRIRIFDGHELVAEHARRALPLSKRVTLDAHRHPGRRQKGPIPESEEERVLRAADPVLGDLVVRLRRRHGGHAPRALRTLHRLYLDYPTQPLIEVVTIALAYGLTDLGRIERMVLKNLSGSFFRLPGGNDEEDSDDER